MTALVSIVTVNKQRVGTLHYDHSGISFAYDADYILAGGEPILDISLGIERYLLPSDQAFFATDPRFSGIAVHPARWDSQGRVVMAMPWGENP